jgi:cytochrome d ubiquinol oxidase subunit I
MSLAALQLFRKKLFGTKWILWALFFMMPFPYINTTGWYTRAEDNLG